VLWEITGAVSTRYVHDAKLGCVAAVEMIRSGELWTYLYTSLVYCSRVSRSPWVRYRDRAIAGRATGARRGVKRLPHISVFHPSGRAGCVIVAVGGYEQTAKVINPVACLRSSMLINTYQGVRRRGGSKMIEVGVRSAARRDCGRTSVIRRRCR